jgi:hypothetical protein
MESSYEHSLHSRQVHPPTRARAHTHTHSLSLSVSLSKMYLKDTGYGHLNWIKLAKIRVWWWAFIIEATNLRIQ